MSTARRLLTLLGVGFLAIGLAGCPDRTAEQADQPPPPPQATEQPDQPELDPTEGEIRTVVLNATGMH